jgi:hypothetical protein
MISYIYVATATTMNEKESLDLKRMINEMNCENNTDKIRKLKHSSEIAHNIKTIHDIRTENPRWSQSEISEKCQTVCSFLYSNYTDIFHRCVRGELDLVMMGKFLTVLQMIEKGSVDQHEGSVMVGKILKEIYVDSALKRADALDAAAKADTEAATTTTPKPVAKPISWREYKANANAK